MLVKSCLSRNLDPYRAGVEIAGEVADIEPEVLFVFSSIHYRNPSEILEAIYAEQAPCVPLLVGNSGFGVYSIDDVTDVGISVLAINTKGKVRWRLASRDGLATKPFACAQDCLRDVLSQCSSTPQFLFMAGDFRTDASEVLRALNQGTQVPIVGGLAADDYSFESSFILANQVAANDQLVLLAADGEIGFDIQLGNCPLPIGKPARITRKEGTNLYSVDDIPVMEFLEREVGLPLDHIDKVSLTLRTVHPNQDGIHQVRSMLLPTETHKTDCVKLFGAIDRDDLVQVCIYPPQRMIQDIDDIAQRVIQSNRQPQAALIVSCGGRKSILGDSIRLETENLCTRLPSLQGLAGYPSSGEFAPMRGQSGYTPTCFHNMTYVLLLLSES